MPIYELDMFLGARDREAEKTLKLLQALASTRYDFLPDAGHTPRMPAIVSERSYLGRMSSRYARLVRVAAGVLVSLVGAHALATTAASAQDIICCNSLIRANGPWIGAIRPDCQDYLNTAPPATLALLCKQRDQLACMDTSRCDQLPRGESDTVPPAPPPVDPDTDGVVDGFGMPPPPSPAPPPASPLPPRRLVYLVPVPLDQTGDKPAKSFWVWLDRTNCLVPLGPNNRPADPASAKYAVRGRLVRGNGRVRIEAQAQELAGGARFGPFTGEAAGDTAAAVSGAMRTVLKQMKLVCAR